VQTIIQFFDQVGSGDKFWPGGRDEELGEQNRSSHTGIIPKKSKSAVLLTIISSGYNIPLEKN